MRPRLLLVLAIAAVLSAAPSLASGPTRFALGRRNPAAHRGERGTRGHGDAARDRDRRVGRGSRCSRSGLVRHGPPPAAQGRTGANRTPARRCRRPEAPPRDVARPHFIAGHAARSGPARGGSDHRLDGRRLGEARRQARRQPSAASRRAGRHRARSRFARPPPIARPGSRSQRCRTERRASSPPATPSGMPPLPLPGPHAANRPRLPGPRRPGLAHHAPRTRPRSQDIWHIQPGLNADAGRDGHPSQRDTDAAHGAVVRRARSSRFGELRQEPDEPHGGSQVEGRDAAAKAAPPRVLGAGQRRGVERRLAEQPDLVTGRPAMRNAAPRSSSRPTVPTTGVGRIGPSGVSL